MMYFLFLTRNSSYQNCLNEAVQVSGHNMFYVYLLEMIPNYHQILPFI